MADQVVRPAVYEHPWAVRFCHWANAVSMLVLAMSGLQIFTAFPSFGAKIPETEPDRAGARSHQARRLARRRAAVALHVHVDLCRRRRRCTSTSQIISGHLPDGPVQATRRAGRVADGAPLLLVRAEAAPRRVNTIRCRNSPTPVRDWVRHAVAA